MSWAWAKNERQRTAMANFIGDIFALSRANRLLACAALKEMFGGVGGGTFECCVGGGGGVGGCGGDGCGGVFFFFLCFQKIVFVLLFSAAGLLAQPKVTP